MPNTYWKGELYKFLKNNKLKFPEIKVVAKLHCEIIIENQIYEFDEDLDISKNVKNNSLEKLYCKIVNKFKLNKVKEDVLSQKSKQKEIKIETFIENKLDDTNKGFKILETIGWKQGTALGKNNKGILEPIILKPKNDKKGIDSN